MFFEQLLCSVLRCRDNLHLVGHVPLTVGELEHGVVDPSRPLVGQYRQVIVFPDHQMPREATVDFPTGVNEALFYLFPSHVRHFTTDQPVFLPPERDEHAHTFRISRYFGRSG
jgi:hypothetical protein